MSEQEITQDQQEMNYLYGSSAHDPFNTRRPFDIKKLSQSAGIFIKSVLHNEEMARKLNTAKELEGGNTARIHLPPCLADTFNNDEIIESMHAVENHRSFKSILDLNGVEDAYTSYNSGTQYPELVVVYR